MPPKTRPGRTPTTSGGGRNPLVLGAAAAGAVILAILLFVLLSDNGGTEAVQSDASAVMKEAGCTFTTVAAPENKSDHSDVASPDDVSDAWNTDPPTAGPHYGQTVVFGAYDDPVQPARLVHNLEHGAVFIQYGSDVAPETVDALKTFYSHNLNGTVLAPYPKLGKKIALGAWLGSGGGNGTAVLATCPSFDDTAFQAFLSAYQFKGKEAFPPSSMTPGNG
jgi:hypothetical protein